MKNIRVGMGLGSVVGLLVAFGPGSVGAQENATMQAFMREKLVYSQNIIEGISLERQEVVVTNASRLLYMTRSNLWMELGDPGYLAKTRKFQDEVILLGAQARATNTAGALQAYAKVTAGCVECHRLYRPAQTNQVFSLKNP